jgi:hypothetical protein
MVKLSQWLWYRLVIARIWELSQENHELVVILDYTVRPCLQNKSKKNWLHWQILCYSCNYEVLTP